MLKHVFLLLLLMGCNVSYASLFGESEQVIALRKQVDEMESRIAKMEQVLSNQALLELYSKVEMLEQEVGRLNGHIEMLSNDNSLLQKRQRDFYIDLDNRLRQIEQPGQHHPSPSPSSPSSPEPRSSVDDVTTSPPSAQASTPSASTGVLGLAKQPDRMVSAAVADSGSLSAGDLVPAGPVENDLYKEAYDSFKSGDYSGAITRFEGFLSNYPHSSLAPGAAYWIGNARYALRDYLLAIDAQKKLISTYPDSSKVPDAFLNIASSQHEMGDSKASRQTLENLLAQYPRSEAAQKAKQRLANFR